MTDLALDPNFDVFLDDRNDIATVDGREKFEQSIAIKLTEFMYDITGDTDFATLKEKIRLQASRVVRNHDMVDAIDRISIEKSTKDPGTVLVEILYTSSATFDVTLNI